MSTPPQPSSAHIHPNTRAHTLPAYHCETGHLPCICAAELPHQSPLPDTHDQQLYHEIARLTRLNAALEDEVFNQYEEIDRLRARNEVLQDCWGACDMGRMDWMGDSSMGSCRSTAGSDTDDAATDAATVEKFGLRQIETELSVLNLQSETALLSMQISRLEKQFVLLGEEMRSLGRCVGVIAEVVGGVRNVDDEEEEGSASPGPGSSAGLGVRSMAGVKSPVCVCFPENLAMRGGMGGRDEDEEFVYGYWGYTNWDQVEEEERSSGSGNGMACEGRYNDQGAETSRAGGWQSRNANAEQGESMEVDMAHIHELQHQIARLENQIQRLGDSLSTKPEASSPPVSQNPSEPPDSPPEESAKELPPHIRGGSGHLSLHPSLQPLIHPSNSSENFSHLYAHLLHHTSSTCTQCPSSDCTEAWMSLATVLQTHNAFLEREVEEFKKMSESLMGDVRWQMGNLGKLEELCEGLEQERDLLLREVEELKKTVERSDNRGFQSEEIAQEAIERGVWDMHASAADDEIEQSTPKTSKSHVHHTAFIYRPSPSYIIFPTTPPQIFHFPSAPTLPLIYALLNHRRTHVGEDNPYLMRVREILDVRTAMGISLPDSFEEEEIEVGIPDLLFSEWEDGDVEIAAWKSGELDLRDVGGFLERLVLDDEKECEEENRGEWAEVNHYGDLCTETMSETGSAKGSSDGGLCICSDCTGEERDKEFNGDQQPETPGVAIRGSGYEQYASSSADPKNGLEPEQGEYGCEWDEYILPRSSRGVYIAADFLLRPTTPAPSPPKATKAVKSEALTQESQASHVIDLIYDKDSWQHPKGRGCEEWATFPDRNRQRCTLCHLPFSRQDLLKRSSSVESIAYEDDAPIPTSIPPFPSPLESDKVINKTDCINSKQSILDDTNAHLRGGAAVSDTSESEYSNHSAHSAHEDDWRTEWNDLADQNHHSKHQHQTFRNYNTLSTKETGKPVTPIARQNPHPRLDLPSLFDERGNKRFNAWSIGYQGLKPGAEDVMQEVKSEFVSVSPAKGVC
ncbi:hypothetical protein J1614_003181 [Plenodomus biglobosus]|nr:hypothetical protein J1614_003181 [Plenodomus biglobosus]